MGVGSPGYYVALEPRQKVTEAQRLLREALQAEREEASTLGTKVASLEHADRCLSQALRAWPKRPRRKKRKRR